MAAKRTSELIPLCHPLPLSHRRRARSRSARAASRSRRLGRDRRRRPASRWRRSSPRRSPRSPSTTWRRRSTRGWSSSDVPLVEKTKEPVSGRAAVLTVVRRRRARGRARTRAATSSQSCSPATGYEVERRVVPDEAGADRGCARASCAADGGVVLTTGGTGVGAARRHAGGDAHRSSTATRPGSRRRFAPTRSRKTPHGLLSRGVAGIARHDTRRQPPGLARRLPRRLRRDPRPALPHALELLAGERDARTPDVSASAATLPRRFASLVKLEHTVFALPFAYVGALLAVDGWPGWSSTWLWITVAMVGARTLAMALNRLIDAEIDAGTRARPAASFRRAPCRAVRCSRCCAAGARGLPASPSSSSTRSCAGSGRFRSRCS